jgi:hypothetical protein
MESKGTGSHKDIPTLSAARFHFCGFSCFFVAAPFFT